MYTLLLGFLGCDIWGIDKDTGDTAGAHDTHEAETTDTEDTCEPDVEYCAGDGDVWARDCYGNEEQVQSCSGQCEQDDGDAWCCVSHDRQGCSGDSLYWYDSCGNREELAEDCASTTGACYEGACVDTSCDVYISFATDGSCDDIEGVWYNSSYFLWYDEEQPKRITWGGTPGSYVTIECTMEIWSTGSYNRDCLRDLSFTCEGAPYYYTHYCND